MARFIAFLLSAWLLSWTGAGAADSRREGGIKGADDRTVADVSVAPWRSIGRLNRAGKGYCTAVLVGPRRILTAAHCLWSTRNDRYYPPDSLVFVIGYDRGNFAEVARGTRLHVAPGFDARAPRDPQRVAHDWAFVDLDGDPGSRFGFLPLAPFDRAELGRRLKDPSRFVQAGYSRDRQHVLTKHEACPLLGYIKGAELVAHRCDAMTGDSGAPILYRGDDGYVVAAIHAATTKTTDGRWIGAAVPAYALRSPQD